MGGGFYNDVAPDGAGRNVKLRPRERVEDGFGRVKETFSELRAFGDGPNATAGRTDECRNGIERASWLHAQ